MGLVLGALGEAPDQETRLFGEGAGARLGSGTLEGRVEAQTTRRGETLLIGVGHKMRVTWGGGFQVKRQIRGIWGGGKSGRGWTGDCQGERKDGGV